MDKQVTNQPILFHLDYLSMTVFLPFEEFKPYWDRFFNTAFGDLVPTGRRTAFFTDMWVALAGVTVLSGPLSQSTKGDYITLTIKGEGCKCISLELMARYVSYLIDNMVQFSITRTDLTWDYLQLSPKDMGRFMEEYLWDNKVLRSLAKRGSLVLRRDPAKENDLGGIGTSSLEFGDRASSRMIRCYDMHGFTRLEFQTREDRAHVVLIDVLSQDEPYRYDTALAHLLDFVDMEWQPWRDFIGTRERARLVLNRAREITSEKLKKWLGKQVAPALSVMQDIDSGFTVKLLAHGRMRNRERYSALLTKDDFIESEGSNDNPE